jgi:hypothetical protein
MSAVREVKYLRELHHENVIEVESFSEHGSEYANYLIKAVGRLFFEDEP